MRTALKALQSDLYAIRDQEARAKAAVKVLEELRYRVVLERRPPGTPRPSSPKPQLKVVPSPEDKSG
jgi:hypothetical protein